MNIFKKPAKAAAEQNPNKFVPPAPNPMCPLSLGERLGLIRATKESQLQALAAELVELDTQIAWLKRFPQVEKIIASLRNAR